MDPIKIIEKYYKEHPEAKRFLLAHGSMVAKKALEVAKRLSHLAPDMDFIKEAALLHDIGIFLTYAPDIGCHGDKPYILHGILGREILESEGLPRHAIVCETHVGVGLTIEDIKKNKFPLPLRDMTPKTLEEKIIGYADKFFSKSKDPLREKPLEYVRKEIGGYGEDKLKVFDEWAKLFGDM